MESWKEATMDEWMDGGMEREEGKRDGGGSHKGKEMESREK